MLPLGSIPRKNRPRAGRYSVQPVGHVVPLKATTNQVGIELEARVVTRSSRLLKFAKSPFQELAVSPDPTHTSRVLGVVHILPMLAYATEITATAKENPNPPTTPLVNLSNNPLILELFIIRVLGKGFNYGANVHPSPNTEVPNTQFTGV